MNNSFAVRYLIGLAAITAPALHSATDIVELILGGFTPAMLWANYIAFLPMPWLLFGIYVVHPGRLSSIALLGAVLYGIAFTYFAHTTLYALAHQTTTYENLWNVLGLAYTVHGALMVLGGLLFAWATLRACWLPRSATGLFACGIVLNLLLGLLPFPDIWQTLGTALRNTGLVLMGCKILISARTVV